ncbi:MAG: hypothetical protein BWK80_13785 [Desulfobacteraceae bacterium IS3]|nr:MAG: hypothetical protein BWK80_13785 [Desulfobacteraceae bacterium IS3]
MFNLSAGLATASVFIIVNFRLPLYLLEALLQIFLYMSQKALKISTLSSVPVLYHELSYLPHPFLGSHILLNAETDPALVKRVLEACKIAPGQQRAGQFALAHLQAREQIQQQQFEQSLELKGQWLPGVEGAASSLLALREVARYLNSAEKSEIVHQRLQHLTQAETSLNSVKNQLLSDKSYLSHALRTTLPAWEKVIGDMRREAEKLAVNTLPNPFRAGDPLTQEFGKDIFKGRTDIAKYIESLIADPSQRISLALLGPRRCGKTSLLNMLPEMLPDAVCVFFDLQDNPIDSPDSFFKALSQRAREQARRDRRLDLPLLPEGTPFESASEWLKQLDEIAGERRILICIDEFERLESTFPGTKRELLQLMGLFRATIQHRRKVRLLISGVAAFDELDSLWSDHFINLREVRIGHFDHETSLDLLTKPVPEFPTDAVPLEFAEKVFERTGGLPYLLQLYGSILIQHLNSDKRKHADMGDFKMVEERVLEQGIYYFRNTVNSAPDSAKEILLALSRTADAQTPDPQTRRWLQRRCLITEDGQLAIPVLGRWIREYGD